MSGCISANKIYDCCTAFLCLGDTLSLSNNVFVAIEMQVVSKKDNFLHAFVHQFCAYYVLNMEHPAPIALTLEFFQEVIFKGVF